MNWIKGSQIWLINKITWGIFADPRPLPRPTDSEFQRGELQESVKKKKKKIALSGVFDPLDLVKWMTFVILRGLEAGRNAEGRAMEATGGGGAEGSHSREGSKSLLQGQCELSFRPF